MSDIKLKTLLAEQHAKLLALTPYPWAAVQTWASETRPFLTRRFSDNLADFDAKAKPPKYPGTFAWGVGDATFSSHNPAREAEIAANARDALAALVGTLIKLLDLDIASPPAPAGGDTYVTNIHGSALGAVAVGPKARAKGNVRKRAPKR